MITLIRAGGWVAGWLGGGARLLGEMAAGGRVLKSLATYVAFDDIYVAKDWACARGPLRPRVASLARPHTPAESAN